MGPVLLGRSKICDVSLADSVLSRQHASLTVKSETEIELEDLKSANGTIYKGNRITKQILNIGAVFNIGQHEIKILKVEIKKTVDSEDLTPAVSSITLVPEPSAIREPSVKQPAPAPAAAPIPVPEELTLKTPTFLKEGKSKTHFQTKDWVQVSLLWKDSLVDLKCFDRGDIVTIGEDASNSFSISLTTLPKTFNFLKILPTGLEIQLHPSMKGLVETKDSVVELDDLKKTIKAGMPEWVATMRRYDDPSITDMEDVWGI
jgi:pSer/pThr/pTyr-binding forkhead associated (FHA) protein